jgi:hypothetical protein
MLCLWNDSLRVWSNSVKEVRNILEETNKIEMYWGWILGQNPDKSLRVFLFTIHSHLYSYALKFIFLQTLATSYSFYSAVQL